MASRRSRSSTASKSSSDWKRCEIPSKLPVLSFMWPFKGPIKCNFSLKESIIPHWGKDKKGNKVFYDTILPSNTTDTESETDTESSVTEFGSEDDFFVPVAVRKKLKKSDVDDSGIHMEDLRTPESDKNSNLRNITGDKEACLEKEALELLQQRESEDSFELSDTEMDLVFKTVDEMVLEIDTCGISVAEEDQMKNSFDERESLENNVDVNNAEMIDKEKVHFEEEKVSCEEPYIRKWSQEEERKEVESSESQEVPEGQNEKEKIESSENSNSSREQNGKDDENLAIGNALEESMNNSSNCDSNPEGQVDKESSSTSDDDMPKAQADHKDETMKCQFCSDKKFTSISRLQSHTLSIHAPEWGKPFSCQQFSCNKRFKTNRLLLAHVRRVHNKKKQDAGYNSKQ